MEKHSINLKSQINNKVDNSVFDDMINESKKKFETFESNLSCLKSEIDNLQLKHPNPMTGDDVIRVMIQKFLILVFLHKFQNVSLIVLKDLIML